MSRFRALALSVSLALVAGAFALVVGRLASLRPEMRAARRPAKVLPERDTRAGGNEEAAVGANESRAFLSSPEVERYLNRAYPANEVAWAQTNGARAAWNALQAGGSSSGAWSLIGPSKATYPAVLNFLGDHAAYVTAGRVTAMAIAPSCTKQSCRMWVAAAGGGIWRTTKALSGSPGWEFVSGSFATNAIGALTLDPTDPSANTLYAGTGEPNASGDSEAGLGIYKSTDGGTTWTHLAANTSVPGYTGPAFDDRSISRIVVDPNNANVIYVASALGIRGISSVEGGETIFPPSPTIWGVFKSSDGGANFTFLWNGGATAAQCDTQAEDFGAPCSLVGATDFEIDPSSSSTLYAAAFAIGTWRSTDGGATWSQILGPLFGGDVVDRADFSTVKLPNGKTRMYVGDGGQGFLPAHFFRTDDAAGAAVFADITKPQVLNYCTGQCWYDNVVLSPKGSPDVVYVGGSYDYNQNTAGVSNARGWLLSTDAGATWSDVTKDGDPHHADAIHPDQHAIVLHPNDPMTFFTGSDGGVVRSDGLFADVSYKCAQRGLTGGNLAYCQSLLWRVPNNLSSLNEGFSTLQFQSLSVSRQRPQNNLQGGTQDNGTWQYTGSNVVAYQEMYGDGGQSGFGPADDSLRVNTFTGQANDVNFRNGDPTAWCVASGPIITSPEGAFFYPPVTADPNPSNWGTIYQGSFSVWRTQDWGGPQSYLEANCPEFTTGAATPSCGDFVRIGAGSTDLGSAFYGATRQGSAVAAIERAPSNTGTIWAATGAGRVFISDNGDAAANAVVWTRLDTFSTTDPARFVTSIYVDPSNPHHAWLSYDGYNANTVQPGHVFEVTYTGASATWTDISFNIGDMPITDLVRDDITGDLYASSDFGVMRLPSGSTTWTVAGSGLPAVEVAGLTIVPSARVLYAATHGRSAWVLHLP